MPSPSDSAAADEDIGLMRRIAAGDRVAFGILWERRRGALHRHAARVTGDPALAEDLVAETMIEAWRNADGFAGRSRVATWLFAVLHNKMASRLRKRREAELPEDAAERFVDPGPSPADRAETDDIARLTRRLIDRLGPEHREVLLLTYWQEMPLAEIAAVLDIPENTVKTRLFYARRRLKAMLDGHGVQGVA